MSIDKRQYAVLADRRTSLDTLLWQTPVLSLTAQAFLFSILLGADISRGPRLVAALLSFLVALASMQLMAKHRLHEVIAGKHLEAFEKDAANGLAVIHATAGRNDTEYPELRRWYHFSSYKMWQAVLGVFAITAIAIVVDLTCGSGRIGLQS